jgi:hypothetical protein
VSHTHWSAREKEKEKEQEKRREEKRRGEERRHVTYATNSLVPWEL